MTDTAASVGPAFSLRGTSGGDIRLAAIKEVKKIQAETKGDPSRTLGAAIKKLLDQGLVSKDDAALLSDIVGDIISARKGKQPVEDATENIRSIYLDLLAKPGQTGVAVAIASVCASGPVAGKPGAKGGDGAVAKMTASDTVDVGLAGGALAGALIGGAIGGLGGAAIGGVIGGIIGTAGGLCAAEDDN